MRGNARAATVPRSKTDSRQPPLDLMRAIAQLAHTLPLLQKATLLLASALTVTLGSGCAAPVFSDFQTARVVHEGEWEIAPAVSHLPRLDQTNAGLQAAVGIGSNIEARGQYVRSFTRDLTDEEGAGLFDNADEDFNTVSLGVKVSLIEGVVAAYLPAEVVFAAESEPTIMVRPALIATLPLMEWVEVNSSLNAILPYGLVSVNAGLGVGNLGTWSVRPEVGLMLNTRYVAVGVGFAYRFGGSSGRGQMRLPSP